MTLPVPIGKARQLLYPIKSMLTFSAEGAILTPYSNVVLSFNRRVIAVSVRNSANTMKSAGLISRDVFINN